MAYQSYTCRYMPVPAIMGMGYRLVARMKPLDAGCARENNGGGWCVGYVERKYQQHSSMFGSSQRCCDLQLLACWPESF